LNSEYLLNHVRKRFADNSFTVQCCADELNFSKSYLREIVHSTFKTSPQKLIETIRLEAAIKILYKNNATIYSVCTAAGYSNQKTFRGAFRRRLNISPSELKEKFKNSLNSQKVCEAYINSLWDF
jgi:transcriptional regulator GlxA family with amidase domain